MHSAHSLRTRVPVHRLTSLLCAGIHKNAYPTPTKVSYSETAVLYLIEVMFVSVFVGFVLYGAWRPPDTCNALCISAQRQARRGACKESVSAYALAHIPSASPRLASPRSLSR